MIVNIITIFLPIPGALITGKIMRLINDFPHFNLITISNIYKGKNFLKKESLCRDAAHWYTKHRNKGCWPVVTGLA